MKNQIIFIFALLSFTCDSPTEEKKYEGEVTESSTKEIVLESTGSTWVNYSGVLPCADCAGIQTELKLENSPEKIERSFELSETYLETKDGDRNYKTTGIYEVIYGLEDNPGAMAIRLLDENNAPFKSFLQEKSGQLTLLNQEEKPIQSKLNYSLEMLDSKGK